MKKTVIILILSLMLLVAFCADALAEDWTCPVCSRINNEDMNFCGNCGTEKPTQSRSDSSEMINAWVCPSCSHICPEEDNFCTRCRTAHTETDAGAVLLDRPVFQETEMLPAVIQKTPCSLGSGDLTVCYTAPTAGRYCFWVEDRTSAFEARMSLYSSSGNRLRANDFFTNSPGFYCDLDAGETCSIVLENGGKDPDFTLCIGEPRKPEPVESRSFIRDRMDYNNQKNVYVIRPQITGEYRIDIAEMKHGQDLDLKVEDELGYEIRSFFMGGSMGSGISFDLEAGKLYYVIAEQRTDLGAYKLQLSSPNPPVSVSGCSAAGGFLYYEGQNDTLEYTASETGSFEFSLAFTDADCTYEVSVLDEFGYTISKGYSNTYHADLEAGRNYRILVTQLSGTGSYTLFLWKAE